MDQGLVMNMQQISRIIHRMRLQLVQKRSWTGRLQIVVRLLCSKPSAFSLESLGGSSPTTSVFLTIYFQHIHYTLLRD